MKPIVTYLCLLMVTGISLHSEEDTPEFSVDVLKERYRSALNMTQDVVKERHFVPSAEKPQGELRIIERGNTRVIQSLLFTRYPSRFLKEINKKESIAWPMEMPGKGDSDLYLKAVELAIDYAKQMYPLRKDKSDKRKKLLVELVHSSSHTFAAFYTIELDESDGGRQITSTDLFSIIPLSDVYVKREMLLILMDAFKYERKKAERALGFTVPEDPPEITKAMEAAQEPVVEPASD